jgi:hypothetical protein
VPLIVAPPDIEADVIADLRAASLTATVGWEIKGPWPCLQVLRVGGTPDVILRVDQALIQLSAWGDPNDQSSAQRIALSALLASADARLVGHMSGTTTSRGVYGRVLPVTRGQWAPDDSTHQQRYLSRHLVAAHAV